MYLERRIVATIHGEPEFDFSAIIGWKALGVFYSFDHEDNANARHRGRH